MNFAVALLPWILILAAAVVSGWGWKLARGALAVIAMAFAMLLLPPVEALLMAAPEGDPKQAQQAVVFGFSYESEVPDMKPGPANERLWQYARDLPGLKDVFAQEGVLAAATDPGGKAVKRFHRHDPTRYINSLGTARCALDHIDRSKPVLVVAHELQLARAVFDLRRVCPDCRLIVPAIASTGFVPNGKHQQARSAICWKLAELFVSRPRDAFGTVPESCPLPIAP